MVLSPSAGSSHRVTGLKCMAKVSVPSGAAAAIDGPAPRTRNSDRTTPNARRGSGIS